MNVGDRGGRLVRGRLQAGAEARQVHAQGRCGRREGGKGSLASMPIEVPDLAKVESGADGSVSKLPSAGSLLIVKRSRRCRAALGSAAPVRGFRARRPRGSCRRSEASSARRSRWSSCTRSTTRSGPDDRQGRRERRRQHPEGGQDAGREGPAEGDRVGARRGLRRPDPARQLRPGQVHRAAEGHRQARQAGGDPGGAVRGEAVA